MILKTYKVKNIRRISWVKLWLLLVIILFVFHIITKFTGVGIFLFPPFSMLLESNITINNGFLGAIIWVVLSLIYIVVISTMVIGFMKLFAHLFNINILLKINKNEDK